MPQLFHRAANALARAALVGFGLFAAGGVWLAGSVYRSPYVTQANVVRDQPVPFSHRHHVAAVGLDCRYCHWAVEEGPSAGVPGTATCMHCHSRIWTRSDMLEPVRESHASGRPIAWTRVHDLPDFVRFDHGIHAAKGVDCVSCHGRVDRMPLTWKTETLFMEWCLECHRRPERFVDAPLPPERAAGPGDRPENPLGIAPRTDCTTCHQ